MDYIKLKDCLSVIAHTVLQYWSWLSVLDNVAVVFKIIFFIFSLSCLNLSWVFALWYVTSRGFSCKGKTNSGYWNII